MTAHAKLKLFTIPEIASSLNVSIKTIRRLIEDGQLHAHRVGRCLRISEEDVRLYLNRVRN